MSSHQHELKHKNHIQESLQTKHSTFSFVGGSQTQIFFLQQRPGNRRNRGFVDFFVISKLHHRTQNTQQCFWNREILVRAKCLQPAEQT